MNEKKREKEKFKRERKHRLESIRYNIMKKFYLKDDFQGVEECGFKRGPSWRCHQGSSNGLKLPMAFPSESLNKAKKQKRSIHWNYERPNSLEDSLITKMKLRFVENLKNLLCKGLNIVFSKFKFKNFIRKVKFLSPSRCHTRLIQNH